MSRNAFKKSQLVDLIVARRVYSVSDSTQINKKKCTVIEDENEIINLDQLSSDLKANGPYNMFITGEVIGYCEVLEKTFGLGGNYSGSTKNNKGEKLRPYLSNLSVVENARKSGVGSKLLDACEEAVRDWNVEHSEIVLQVEEDNQSAIQWYKRRGWEFVFADPTCRRYDTSGFFLRETRITKYAMIKRLETNLEIDTEEKDKAGAMDDLGYFFVQKLRDSFTAR